MKEKTDLKILVVAQQKGGVGKTTLSQTLGVFGARPELGNKRVLMLDLDFQASLSKLSLDMEFDGELGSRPPLHPDYDPKDPEHQGWSGRSSAADIFWDGFVMPYPVQRPGQIAKLEILPAHKSRLKEVEEQDRSILRDRVHDRLHEFFSLDDVRQQYDLVIIDTGPKESPLVTTALRAATHMLVPLTLEAQCLDGMLEMLSLWKMERGRRGSGRETLRMAGLVVNQLDVRYAVHKAHLASLQRDEVMGPLLCETLIPKRAAITERDVHGSHPGAVFDLPVHSDARQVMLDFCGEIYSKLFPAEAARFNQLRPKDDADAEEAVA